MLYKVWFPNVRKYGFSNQEKYVEGTDVHFMTLWLLPFRFQFCFHLRDVSTREQSNAFIALGLPDYHVVILSLSWNWENCKKQNYGINRVICPAYIGALGSLQYGGDRKMDGRNLGDYLGYQLVLVWLEETVNVRILHSYIYNTVKHGNLSEWKFGLHYKTNNFYQQGY